MASPRTNLLRFLGLRHLRHHWLRSLLGFVSVMLGVALYVSTDVANTSVIEALENSGRELAGAAEWQVTRGRSIGIEVGMLEKVRAVPGATAAPVIQTSTTMTAPVRAGLLILGVDFQSDAMLRLYRGAGEPIDLRTALATATTANAILLPRPFAERHGLRTGASVTLDTRAGRRQFTVTGVLDAEGPARALGGDLGVIEIGLAGRLFGREGRVDRIEVAGASRGALAAACPDCLVEPAQRPDASVEDAVARLRSLVAIGFIAMLVGAFIVYNTVAVSVMERLKEIGTLRSIGALRSDLQWTLVVEWALLGLLGSVAGIAGGFALAKGLVVYTQQAVNVMSRIVEVRELVLAPSTIAVGLGLGILATVAAAWFPVRTALAQPPVAILRAHTYRLNDSYRGAFRLGLLCLVLGSVLIWLLRRWMTVGLASTGLFFVGMALVLPQVTIWTARRLRPTLARLFRIEGFLAADNAAKFPQRTALTVVALGGSLAMLVASATLIEGFREASRRWLEYTLPFDCAVSSTDFTRTVYSGNVFPAAIQDEVRRQPCVEDCYGVRAGFADVDGHNVMVLAVELAGFTRAQRRRTDHPDSKRRFQDPAIVADMVERGAICVSDNFTELHGTGAGDSVVIATPGGPRSLRVLASVEDYSWPRGVVFMDLATYRRLLGDTGLNYVDVMLRPGVARDEARAQLVQALGNTYSLFVFEKAEIVQVASDTLDRIMALANVQVVIAIVIGFLGICNTLWLSVLQRTREIGLLRAIGMSRRQVGRTVVMEALLVAFVGGIVGVSMGLLAGWLPLRLFTMLMTGYLTPMVLPWGHVVAALVLSLVIGAAAAFLPARRAARLDVLAAIGYE